MALTADRRGAQVLLAGKYLPSSSTLSSAAAWGDQQTVRELLGDAVDELQFNYDDTIAPALCPAHLRASLELSVAPVAQAIEHLGNDADRLETFCRHLDTLVGEYFSRNRVRQRSS